MDFDQAVQAFDHATAAPVAEAQQALAPALAELKRDRAHFTKLAETQRPIFEAGRAKEQAAAARGVVYQPLRTALRQVYGDEGEPGLLRGGLESYDDAIRQIKGLTPLALERDPHLVTRLHHAPTRLRGNAGRVETLAAAITRYVAELPELIQRAVPSVTVAAAPERREVGVPVQSDFDPRR